MADDTQVVEKRIKSTIIRRRKEEPAPEKVVPSQTPVKVEAVPVVTTSEKTVVPPIAKPRVLVKEPLVIKPASRLTVKAPAVENASAVSSAVEKAVEAPQSSDKKPAVVPHAPRRTVFTPVIPTVIPVRKNDPKPPVKPAAPVNNSEKKIVAPSLVGPIANIVIDDDDEATKKAKLKKGPRRREDAIEVDLEGVGRVASMTQLTRIASIQPNLHMPERVFQPGRAGGGLRRKKIVSKKGLKKTNITTTKAEKRVVEVDKLISVGRLADAMGVKANLVIAKLVAMGVMATINQEIDFDTAQLIAQEFQFEVKDIAFNEQKLLEHKTEAEEESGGVARPPVVTIMGHVDHGKTSLLDAIREASVAAGEAGGITQHIGAYTVSLPEGNITFLDTPGHEAFAAMRARGASVTDIVILVVAADDGLMPQTLESIHHAKSAGVPIVVAVNKMDKPDADPERVKRQLAENDLISEEWGGQTQFAYVSAKQKTGLDDLLEKVLLQAEVLELSADPTVRAKGTVIEAKLDKGRGPVVTLLVRQGTLRQGEILVAGEFWGRVRAMSDYRGKPIAEAGPSVAVEVLGLNGVPKASDPFHIVKDESVAREVSENRGHEARMTKLGANQKVSLEDVFAKIQSGDVKELGVVLKTDVQGSLEALSEALKKLATEKVTLKVIHAAVGGISESDILLASASKAVVIGFNVRPETKALSVAEQEGIEVKTYKIIYDLVNDVKLAMAGLLAPTRKETYLGRAEVRQAFTVSKVGTVAGCFVIDGKIARSAEIRLLRDNIVMYEGKISSLKRFKDDAREVAQGFECGLGVDGYNDIKPGDVIEAYNVELIRAEL